MPPNQDERGTPKDWLKRARSNLARAEQPKSEDILWEDLCFDAQQAAEKALKAVLISRDVSFPYVHDIAELLTLLEQDGVVLPGDIRKAAALNRLRCNCQIPWSLRVGHRRRV